MRNRGLLSTYVSQVKATCRWAVMIWKAVNVEKEHV